MSNTPYYSYVRKLLMLTNYLLWISSNTCSALPFSTADIILSFRTTMCPCFIFSLSMAFSWCIFPNISRCCSFRFFCYCSVQSCLWCQRSWAWCLRFLHILAYLRWMVLSSSFQHCQIFWILFRSYLCAAASIYSHSSASRFNFCNLSRMAFLELRELLRSVLPEYMLIEAGVYYINKPL